MEDVIVTYSVPHRDPFGFLIALFIAVTGLNAGSYLASFIFACQGKREFLPLAKFSGLVVLFLWAVAPILLLLDIGQPLRFWHLFVYFDPRSPLAWGTLILSAYPFLASLYLYHLFREDLERARHWGFIGLPVALGSHAFAGFVLSFAQARILWSFSLTPVFFLLTAGLSGLALTVIYDAARYYLFLRRSPGAQARERVIFRHLGEALYLLIFANLGLILFYLVKVGISPDLFQHVLTLTTAGKIGPADFFLPLVLGLIAPLALLIIPPTARRPWAQSLASGCILWGNFSLGNFLLTAAQKLPLV